MMTNKSLQLKLYIAGNSPNSLIALNNLKNICAGEFSPDSYIIEVVDLFEQPHRAIEDGVMLTPMLIIASSSSSSVIGNLSNTSSVINLLRSVSEENDVT